MRVIIFNILSIVLLSQVGFSQEKLNKPKTSYTNVFDKVSVYKDFSEVYLGNFGLAKYSLISPFKDNNNELFDLFGKDIKNKTYTDIFFTSGSGKEGVISINHHQKLSKTLNAKLSLTKTSGLGFYLDQKATLSKLVADISYESKNKKYSFNVLTDFYKRINELNGGINDSVFNNGVDDGSLRLLYQTNLTNADLEKSVRVLDFSHSYRLTNDSVTSFVLRQNFNYVTEKLDYVDESNSFYNDYFIDSLGNKDSLKIEYLTHNLYLDYFKGNWSFNVGISNSYADYKADSVFIPSMIHSGLAGVSFVKNKINFSSNFSYTFSGFLKGNMFAKNTLKYTDSGLFFNNIIVNGNYTITTPILYHGMYYSNHLKWDNILETEKNLAFSIKATNQKHKLKVGGEFQLRNDFVYYDSLSLVAQTDVIFYQVNASKHVEIMKWLHWVPTLFYQNVVSDENIALPNFVAQNRLYAQGKLFKKILTFKVGVDVLYYTDFFAKAYNPSFDNFYVQNKTKAGNYPFIDVFAEFYSKDNLAFFVKFAHVNSGFTGTNYLASPNYRQQDRAFKFGLKWRLFD